MAGEPLYIAALNTSLLMQHNSMAQYSRHNQRDMQRLHALLDKCGPEQSRTTIRPRCPHKTNFKCTQRKARNVGRRNCRTSNQGSHPKEKLDSHRNAYEYGRSA